MTVIYCLGMTFLYSFEIVFEVEILDGWFVYNIVFDIID